MTLDMKVARQAFKDMVECYQKFTNKNIPMSKEVKTIEISKEVARKIYSTATPELKLILDQNFDKKDLVGDVMDRIKTPADAVDEYISIHGVLPDMWHSIIAYDGSTRRLMATKANVLLDIIEVVLNEGWEADYSNRNEAKHFAYFEFHGSAFAFRVSLTGYDGTYSNVGSRRSFKSEKLANYFGTQFIELHNLALLKK